MSNNQDVMPDSTAARVALWRALHVEADAPPHVLEDTVGLQLLAPGDDWRQRGDMDPQFTRPFRASIVARARFIEDLATQQASQGLGQYVILGAGLDSFAQRKPQVAAHLNIFEVDRPGPQAWERQRLTELGYGIPQGLHFVPEDFEDAGGSWRDSLVAAGFDVRKPVLVASTGVSMYLTREATMATLRQIAELAPGSTLVMSFLLPLDMAPPRCAPDWRWRRKAQRPAAHLSSASTDRRRSWRWRVKRASRTQGMCRRWTWRSAISRGGRMGCGRRRMRRSWWWRGFSRLSWFNAIWRYARTAHLRAPAMLTILFTESIEQRLSALAMETGRTKTTLAREAILECIYDLEDHYLAEARALQNRKTIPLEDVMKRHGLEDWDRPDRRIQIFLRQRVMPQDNPRSINGVLARSLLGNC